jgi:hypothetical protein
VTRKSNIFWDVTPDSLVEMFPSSRLQWVRSPNITLFKKMGVLLVLYGCETLSLTLFESTVLRRIFGPKRDRRLEKAA